MAESTFACTPIERVALETIREERPQVSEALSARLGAVLAASCQGLVVTEAETEDLLARLRKEFVGRMLVETAPRGRTRIFGSRRWTSSPGT